jgi:ethanolamine utilization protein EutS
MQRIIQELVPGKQITLAHIIANPEPSLYASLSPSTGARKKSGETPNTGGAVGLINVTPPETAIIAADLAVKASGVAIVQADRVSGSLIVTGSVSEVESAFTAVTDYAENVLKYEVCRVTKT